MYDKDQQRNLFELSKQLLQKKDILVSEISDLRQAIGYHEWRYYLQNDPVLSDFEYDTLFKKLETLEALHPDLVTPDSPTQRVGKDIAEGEATTTVSHLAQMLSLANSYDAADLSDFDATIKKLTSATGDIAYCVEPKFDGGSIALVYENDVLVRAATRGNGAMGEEMTANARAMHSIPLRAEFLKLGIRKVELRGEALIRKDNFERINRQRADDGLSLFANPRNAATGGLRMKDARETARRGLEAFIYQLSYAVDLDGRELVGKFQSHGEILEMLQDLGFKVPTVERKICKNIAEVAEFCSDWQAKRDNYDYELDGMVVKLNSIAGQVQCGFTSHHPRWAIAFKFQAKQATTTLLSVDFQVGKVGSVTPVAKLEPVQLAGVTVSSVSLHNEEFIRSKDLRLGDQVLVERAGDVIPYIVKVMEDLRNGSEIKIEFPTNCPSCGTLLTKSDEESAWRCDNVSGCKAQCISRIIHHASKDAMDIEGLGKSLIERFFDAGLIQDIADIYQLDYEKIGALDGFGKKSVMNLQAAIEQAKKNPMSRFLYGLSIHHLGKKVSKLIAQNIKNVTDLKDWTEENFVGIKDVGPVVAKNVIAFFADSNNAVLIEKLGQLGVNLSQTTEDSPIEIAADAPLIGKSILFTGTLATMSRKTAEDKAIAAGAKVISAVSAKLNILVVGEEAGSKLTKAQSLKTIQIVTEAEFLDIIA